MKVSIPVLAAVGLLAACCESSGPPPIVPVTPVDSNLVRYSGLVLQLVGHWTDSVSEPGALIHEHWERTDDGFHSGVGLVMVGQDTVFIEHLSLAYDSTGQASYDVRVPSHNEGGTVRFPLTACTGDSMVFENPAHDWPQRIVYALQPDGDWITRVSGPGKEGGLRLLKYRFKQASLEQN